MPDVALDTPAGFVLDALYLDPHAPPGVGQMLMTLHNATSAARRGTD
jgi:hypothetical protein